MNVTTNVTVTGAPDKADILVMDAAIVAENARRLAAGGVQPPLPNSTNPERRASYAAIQTANITANHLANCNTALEAAGSTPLVRQVKQAAGGANAAQLAAMLAAYNATP